MQEKFGEVEADLSRLNAKAGQSVEIGGYEDEHEACFAACGERSQDEIDLFLACSASASSCSEDVNPRRECLANFLDIDTPSDTGSEGPNCVEACQSYLATPCDPPIEGVSSCDEFCAMLSDALQQVAAECLDNAVGCELPADCQLPSGG